MLINEANDHIVDAILGCERLATGKAFDEETIEFVCEQLRTAHRLRLELVGMLHGVQAIIEHNLAQSA